MSVIKREYSSLSTISTKDMTAGGHYTKKWIMMLMRLDLTDKTSDHFQLESILVDTYKHVDSAYNTYSEWFEAMERVGTADHVVYI